MKMQTPVAQRLLAGIVINPATGCWEWQRSLGRSGYGFIKAAGSKLVTALLESYRQFNGEIPARMFVCHKCDNRKCINPEHLFLGTPLDNSRDCVEKGRALRCGRKGEKNVRAKLTEAQVLEIRNLRAARVPYKQVAGAFGVSVSLVEQIASGKIWKHVAPQAAA